MSRAKYVVAGKTRQDQLAHFALNLPVYTHFTNPSRRYADIIVHRQLEAALSNGVIEFTEDTEALVKVAEQCNVKKDSAQSAQEQSVHIESCRAMDKKRLDLGGDLVSEGIVICVYESAFDVLIPEYGFEKRVHCDQLPLKKAEFRKETRVLELYWEKGVTSSTYVPEDERPKGGSSSRTGGRGFGNPPHQPNREKEEVSRKNMETGTMSTDDVDALFDDDDDAASEITEMTAGVSLSLPITDRPTQSMPQSPTLSPAGDLPRTQSESKITSGANDSRMSPKERYFNMFKLREEGGEYIQDVTEMIRVPVILKTDLNKSPP
jgi:protein SSD1